MKRQIASVMIACLLLAGISLAAVPKVMSYQGRLTNSSGTPVADAIYSIKFSIYSSSIGGLLLWDSNNFVPIQTTDGLFSHLIGSTNPLPDSLVKYDSLWLGITVNLDPEITPRTMLASVAYAHRALKSDAATLAVRADTATFAISARYADSTILAISSNRCDSAFHSVFADTAGFVNVPTSYHRISSDTTFDSTSSSTWHQVGTTLVIPPNEVREYVVVSFFTSANCFALSGANVYWSYDIRIGVPGLELSKDSKVFSGLGASGANTGSTVASVITFYYEPTFAERQNGFNVQIFMRKDSGTGSGLASLIRTEVFGY